MVLIIDDTLQARLGMTPEELVGFCDRRHVQNLYIFGSILRSDFNDDSDIDLLVTFYPYARVSLLDLVDMQYELEDLCRRRVDLITRRSIESSPNWLRRKQILETAKIIYES